VAHHVGSLRRNATSGVGGEADVSRTLLNRRELTNSDIRRPQPSLLALPGERVCGNISSSVESDCRIYS